MRQGTGLPQRTPSERSRRYPLARGDSVIVGTGIDVIEIARVERALARRGERFALRIFAPLEIELCEAKRHAAAHYAVRFAAKEAAAKALGVGFARGLRWRDLETRLDAAGRLGLKLRGRAAALAAECAEGAAPAVRLAVARTRTHAMAMVLLESSTE